MKPFILLVVCLSLTKGQLSPKVKAKPVTGDVTPFESLVCASFDQPLVLSDPTGSFASPNYPDPYANGADCWWLIVTDQEDHVITLDFDVFQTEAFHDGVRIRDGNSTMSPFITSFDGAFNPVPTGIRSTGPSMLISFVSDATVNDVGFSATYRAVPVDRSPDACYPLGRPLKLTEYSGSVTSQGYPNYYWNDAHCNWLIESQEVGGTVLLTFDFFNTEASYDFLYIYDGSSSSNTLLARLSGNFGVLPGPYQSSGSSLFLLFESDDTNTGVGFSASYRSVLS